MPMNNRTMRPKKAAATVVTYNAEALAWKTAAEANGGTVTTSTLAAVSTFCNAIDAAGIRDRFVRLNLFCGDFTAALVPLYRSTSYGGTAYGNTTDTNNLFVSGDYNETGASGGLNGNGSTKYLSTGVLPGACGIAETDYHNSAYFPASTNTGGAFIGGTNSTNSTWLPSYSGGAMYVRFGGFSSSGVEGKALAANTGHLMGQRNGGTGQAYRNGSNLSATSSTANSLAFTSTDPKALAVFAQNNNGSIINYFAGRAAAYSIGFPFSDSQATSFYNALQAFQKALNRNA